jgi:hypothetical protein
MLKILRITNIIFAAVVLTMLVLNHYILTTPQWGLFSIFIVLQVFLYWIEQYYIKKSNSSNDN